MTRNQMLKKLNYRFELMRGVDPENSCLVYPSSEMMAQMILDMLEQEGMVYENPNQCPGNYGWDDESMIK